jgi:TrmH family RNA methyltransferase
MAPRGVIRSAAHPAVKRAGAVIAGREAGWIALEGDRLLDDARAAGAEIELVLVSEAREDRARELESAGLEVIRVDEALLARKSALRTSPGVLALCRAPRSPEPSALRATPRALVLVVAGVADPGNLGALARSAEAAGASAFVVIEGGASPWNDKALRGSMGSLLRLPVHRFANADAAERALRELGYRQIRADTRGGRSLAGFDWSGPIALWVGSETGAAPSASNGFERVTIPMRGRAESLNVTVAASLLLYAAGRAEDGA